MEVALQSRCLLYICLSAIGLISFLASYLLDVSEFAKGFIASPFVVALFAALFQLLRDHSTFIKDTIRQRREHAFVIAATSHMSRVVFDKHVEFCEAYTEKLLEALGQLSAKGPTEDATRLVFPLHEIRRKYRLWISPPMASELDEFELKFIRMGVSFHVAEVKSRQGIRGDKDFDEAYRIFHEIMEIKQSNGNREEIEQKMNQGYRLIIGRLQNILGIEKLTNLRDSVFDFRI